MVMYIGTNWVIESEHIELPTTKEFIVYNPKDEKVLFESDDIDECVKHAEDIELKEKTKRYEKAKTIFQTWDKDTLITDLLNSMNDEEIKKFVGDN